MVGVQLDAIIVGAGVCGLCCAIALRRAGHNVTVLEQLSEEISQQGAGVCVLANGSKVLKRWGLRLEADGLVAGAKSDIIDGKSMRLIFSVDGHQEAKEFGESFYCGTRGDLLRLLLNELQREGQTEVKVIYDAEVAEYDADKPAVKLANGEWRQADLVVACDGMQMNSRKVLKSVEDVATPTGLMSIQFLSKSEKLARSEALAGRDRVMIAVDEADDRFSWLGWPCNEGTSYASYLRAPEIDSYVDSEEWQVSNGKSGLLEMFQNWDPFFHELLDAAGDIFVRKICIREPLNKLHAGRLCSLGDALRPMPPFRAQNLPQSIEDAGALEIFFSGLTSKEEVPQRLKAFEKFRMLHVKTIQTLCSTKQNGPNADTEIEKLLEDIRESYMGQDQSHLASPAAFRVWSMAYDVVREAQAALAKFGFERDEL